MCNCSKPITLTDCQRLREFNADPERRFFIYHIFDDPALGMVVAHVPKDKNPNEIAIERNFINQDGDLEWYKTTEHPCLYE